jgi:hypothetical protein
LFRAGIEAAYRDRRRRWTNGIGARTEKSYNLGARALAQTMVGQQGLDAKDSVKTARRGLRIKGCLG